MVWTWLDTLKLLCCGVAGRDRGHHVHKHAPECDKVKIRVGFDGKDTLIDPTDINVKTIFGSFAVLLDSDNQVVPLRKDGIAVEPLVPGRRYVVVLNTHGSSKLKWDIEKKENKYNKHRFYKHIINNSNSAKHHKKHTHTEKKEYELQTQGEHTPNTQVTSKLEQIIEQMKVEMQEIPPLSSPSTKTDKSEKDKENNKSKDKDNSYNNNLESSCVGIGVDENERERAARDNYVPFLTQDFVSMHNRLSVEMLRESTVSKERLLGAEPIIYSRAITSF